LHRLKYKGDKEIGVYLGNEFGKELARSSTYCRVNTIVPVPLHPKKERKRGFNQSRVIAAGLAMSLGAEIMEKAVVRNIHTSTQTRKGRYERWANVENIFSLKEPEKLAGKHVMVVDDVITTGATMEACLQALSRVDGIILYGGSIAFASK
jgi:ComF family protein